MSLSSIVRSCTIRFNTQLEVDDVSGTILILVLTFYDWEFQFKMFLKMKENEFGIALRTARQSIEQGEANVHWMERNSERIIKWLSTVNV